MRLQTSSAGLAIGDADNRYFRLAAGNTASKWQHLYCDGADGYTRPSVSVGHTWTDAGNNWTAFKVDAVDSASGSGSKIADFQVNGASRLNLKKSGRLDSKTDAGNVTWYLNDPAGEAYGFSLHSNGYGMAFVVRGSDPTGSPINNGMGVGNLHVANRIGFGQNMAIGSEPGNSVHTVLSCPASGVVQIADTSGNLKDWKARRGSLSEYLDITEMSAPSAPASNTARLYVEDNGSGKTRLMVLFPTGAAQVLATEP